MTFNIENYNNETIINVFGDFDKNIKIIENNLNVQITNRGEEISINGEKQNADIAKVILSKLFRLAEKGEEIGEQKVNYLISAYNDKDFDDVATLQDNYICLTIKGKPIKPKTIGQQKYIEQMRKNTIVFGTGPAGTGKTYLAMAMAITAFKKNEVGKIILTRPAIEAGESLGFLPGDMQQKVDPYLRPLYDALNEIMGAETFQKNMEKGLIEVAPLAYMRGRTLDNAYIVLDEAQNTTPEQMKMFLTRIGFGSKAIVTGDLTQIDLPKGKSSGLIQAVSILENVEGIAMSHLTNQDVVRHPLVQKIIKAYEKAENRQDYKDKKSKVFDKKRKFLKGKNI